MPTAPPLVATVAEAAKILRLSEGTVRDLIAAGRLGRVPHVGRRTLLAGVELERFAAAGLLVTATRCGVCDAPLDADGCPQHPHIRRLERAS